MTLRHEIQQAIKDGDFALAQRICDEMTGAQAYNWQVKLSRLTAHFLPPAPCHGDAAEYCYACGRGNFPRDFS